MKEKEHKAMPVLRNTLVTLIIASGSLFIADQLDNSPSTTSNPNNGALTALTNIGELMSEAQRAFTQTITTPSTHVVLPTMYSPEERSFYTIDLSRRCVETTDPNHNISHGEKLPDCNSNNSPEVSPNEEEYHTGR